MLLSILIALLGGTAPAQESDTPPPPPEEHAPSAPDTPEQGESEPAPTAAQPGQDERQDPSVPPPDPSEEATLDRRSMRLLRRDAKDQTRLAYLEKVYHQRTLANHPFIQPQVAAGALPTTHVAAKAGLGAWIRRADEDRDARTSVALDGGLDVGVRFGRYAGLRGRFAGVLALSEADRSAVAAEGVAIWDVDLGAPIRAVYGLSTAVSVVPSGYYRRVNTVDVDEGLEALATDIATTARADLTAASQQMLGRVDQYGGLLHVAWAQSTGSVFGFQLSVGGGLGETRIRQVAGTDVDLRRTVGLLEAGLALSLDMHPVPVAIMVEYGPRAKFGTGDRAGNDDLAHAMGAGLYFNGLTNTVGLEFAGRVDEERIFLTALITLRAYF